MIRPPRQTFRESPHCDIHKKLVLTEAFQVACDYALLALLQDMPESKDPSQGWDNHSQMVGARRVIDILKTLHQSPEETKGVKPPTLNYKV